MDNLEILGLDDDADARCKTCGLEWFFSSLGGHYYRVVEVFE